MASKIGKTGWLLTYIVAGVIDVIQFIIGFFGAWLSLVAIGVILIAINEASDPFIAAIAIGYFQIRGVSIITKPKRLISLLGVTGIEELTGGIAPFWVVDVWYIHRDVKKEEVQIQAQKEQFEWEQTAIQQPLYQNGVRMPVAQQTSNAHIAPAPQKVLNQKGRRRPTSSNITSGESYPGEAAATKEVFRHMGYTKGEAEEAVMTPEEQMALLQGRTKRV